MFMKFTFKHLLILGALLIAGTNTWVFTQSAGGPAARTGAPINANQNEQTCRSCHGEPLTQNASQLSISIDGNPSEYVPGNTYTITVTNNAQAVRRGFQLVAIDENYNNAGSFTAGANTKILVGAGRSYMCHSNPNQSTWSFQWTAPASTVGTITFYASSRSAGTGIYTNSLSLSAPVTANKQIVQIQSLHVYPNPASDYLVIKGHSQPETIVSLDLVSLNGQVIQHITAKTNALGEFAYTLQASNLPKMKGTYMLRYINGHKYEIKKIQII